MHWPYDKRRTGGPACDCFGGPVPLLKHLIWGVGVGPLQTSSPLETWPPILTLADLAPSAPTSRSVKQLDWQRRFTAGTLQWQLDSPWTCTGFPACRFS